MIPLLVAMLRLGQDTRLHNIWTFNEWRISGKNGPYLAECTHARAVSGTRLLTNNEKIIHWPAALPEVSPPGGEWLGKGPATRPAAGPVPRGRAAEGGRQRSAGAWPVFASLVGARPAAIDRWTREFKRSGAGRAGRGRRQLCRMRKFLKFFMAYLFASATFPRL